MLELGAAVIRRSREGHRAHELAERVRARRIAVRHREERRKLVDGSDVHDGSVGEERHADPGRGLRGGREVERLGERGAGAVEERERLLGEARVGDVHRECANLEASLLLGGHHADLGLEAERATVGANEGVLERDTRTVRGRARATYARGARGPCTGQQLAPALRLARPALERVGEQRCRRSG